MHAKVTSFQERNHLTIGIVGIVTLVAVVVGTWYYDSIPLISATKRYTAYFTEAGGLTPNAEVQVAGITVGKVGDVELDGQQVRVSFRVSGNVRLGDRTEAAVKTKSLLGTKMLGVTPRGDGWLKGPIPLERTTPAYQLPDALGDLSAAISGIDTDRLADSLHTLAETFQDTPPDLRVAVQGVSRFAKTISRRDNELRTLLANARKSTNVLAQRSDQIVRLVAEMDALLSQINAESAALGQLSANISLFSREISGFIDDNQESLTPLLDKLNGVLTIVEQRKEKLQEWLKRFNWHALGLGEAVSAGPFFKAYVSNVVPGQFIQPYIESAFSDLGLDPNVLLPSDRTDPQVGQPGTPPLPVPYPRTGQGGPPRVYLPDAITGNAEDQPCPLNWGTGCYPLRDEPPAPPPGGAPPGPPAPAPPDQQSAPVQPQKPIFQTAPGEVVQGGAR
ncbi:MCE family protein [Mycolicibacter kumamotonensis]|uniref:MCE family protein n=1 Tax=Mycolicibacter kumamotonensis TaxID=354243 RepID=A0A7K3L8E9_9MYCO|nr:MCE family protein [Mycolicibacter kumamotonensis]